MGSKPNFGLGQMETPRTGQHSARAALRTADHTSATKYAVGWNWLKGQGLPALKCRGDAGRQNGGMALPVAPQTIQSFGRKGFVILCWKKGIHGIPDFSEIAWAFLASLMPLPSYHALLCRGPRWGERGANLKRASSRPGAHAGI